MPLILFLGLFPAAALAMFRAWALDAERGVFTDCKGCFVLPALSSDMWVLASLAGLLVLPAVFDKRWIAIMVGILGAAILLVFTTDVMVTQVLSHRLHLTDVLRYGDETGAQLDMLLPFLSRPMGFALVAGSLTAIGLYIAASLLLCNTMQGRSGKSWRHGGPILLTILAATGAWAGQRTHYLDLEFYENVFFVNARDTSLREHSATRLAELRALPEPTRACMQGTNRRPSLILVVLESWSLYQSRLFSGLNDYTPRLDNWARTGAWFPDYYSNGFATETALIGLLNGQIPIPTHRAWGVLAFDKVDQDAHRALASAGYHTAFFTTGALSFDDREAWARNIGLKHIEGAEHPSYKDLPRGPFDAASDRALVDRFLVWFDQERPNQPFMATLLTVGTHPPFVDTDPGDPDEPGERAAFARADREIARLVKGLDERGFLRDGILVIVGDHRAMTPASVLEMARYGEDGFSRVPAMALGATGLAPGPVSGSYQHTDLLPSLLHLASTQSCLSDWQGLMFGPSAKSAKVVVYQHPALRDELRVKVGGETFRLKLDGDDSRWIGESPTNGAEIMLEVMRQRVARDKW